MEVTHVLRRFVSAGELSEARARGAIEDHLAMGISRYPHDGLLERIWQLRANCTAYDAAYYGEHPIVDVSYPAAAAY